MKKLLFLSVLLSLSTVTLSAKETQCPCQKTFTHETVIGKYATQSELVKIQVYEFVRVGANGAYSRRTVNALYDASAQTIIVGKQPYTIHSNPAYGQENDYRSEYRYHAGNYYFNL